MGKTRTNDADIESEAKATFAAYMSVIKSVANDIWTRSGGKP